MNEQKMTDESGRLTREALEATCVALASLEYGTLSLAAPTLEWTEPEPGLMACTISPADPANRSGYKLGARVEPGATAEHREDRRRLVLNTLVRAILPDAFKREGRRSSYTMASRGERRTVVRLEVDVVVGHSGEADGALVESVRAECEALLRCVATPEYGVDRLTVAAAYVGDAKI